MGPDDISKNHSLEVGRLTTCLHFFYLISLEHGKKYNSTI
jgi:hypothetical protein